MSKNKNSQTISTETVYKIFRYFYTLRRQTRESIENQIIVRLLYETGIEVYDLVRIHLDDINFNRKLIRTYNREVFLTKNTEKLIKAFIKNPYDKDLLFVNPKTNRGYRVTTIETKLRDLQKSLNLNEKITPLKWQSNFKLELLRNSDNQAFFALNQMLGNIKLGKLYNSTQLQKIYMQYNTCIAPTLEEINEYKWE